MDVQVSDEATVLDEDSITADPGSTNFDSLQSIASGEDTVLVTGKPGEILTRVELDLACFSEKLVNLNILVMHVAMRESDFEAFVSDNDHELGDSALKALEFDFLSGVLDSEVRELDSFMSTVQSEINNICEFVSSYKHSGHSFDGIDDKIHDSEESLKQSIDQVSEIKAQSAKFQRILSSCIAEQKEESEDGAHYGENSDFLELNEKVKLQTAEQQRHFLRMLEKSLARELDLEKKVCELKQMDEETKLELQSSKQEAVFMEEEALVIWQRAFEAENVSEVLMGSSKETLSLLHLVQSNLNDSIQREEKQRSELDDLKEISFKAEGRAKSAEGEFKLLRENNVKLNEELATLRAKSDESEKVDLLERQLKEYETRLQLVLASADASEEKQRLLYDTINDMESIIGDLKSRVQRAEIRAEGVEDNCIKFSKTNSELNEEIIFLRMRLECLEGSLRKFEETKMATAKDIGIRTKVITDLVMQLALERERLHKQISSLTKENKLMSQQSVRHSSGDIGKDYLVSKNRYNNATYAEETKEGSDLSTTSFKMEKINDNKFGGEGETKIEAVRNINARQINYRYFVMATLALAFSVLAGVWVNQQEG